MGQSNEFSIGPFRGPVTSVDARFLKDATAADVRNVRYEDGRLLPRYGYRTLATAPTGTFDGVFGFDAVRGWNASGVLVEEYLSFEDTGSLQPYSVHPLTGARSLITHSGCAVSIPEGPWHSASFDNKAFCWALSSSAYEHELGNSDYFRKVDTTDVPNPASGVMLTEFSDQESADLDGDPDWTFDWDGADSGTISKWENGDTGTPGSKTFVSEDDATMVWNLNEVADINILSYVRMQLDFNTLVAGKPDFSGIAQLKLRITHAQGTSSFDIFAVNYFSLKSSGGTEVVMKWEIDKVVNRDENNNITDTQHDIILSFLPSTPASAIDTLVSTRYLEGVFSFRSYNQATTRTNVTFHAIELWDDPGAAPSSELDGHTVKFGFSFYKSDWDAESELIKESPSYFMSLPSKFFTSFGSGGEYLGNTITLYSDEPSGTGDDDIDQVRYWFKDDEEGIWRHIATTEYSTGGYEVPYTYAELIEGTARAWEAYRPIGSVKWAVPYAGCMVWLTQGGKDNIDVSAVGEPKKLWRATQTSEERGVRTSMSPALDDEPVWGVGAGESLVVLGNRGAYASVGLRPIDMTPFKKLPGSKGAIGPRAATRWKDDGGNPGVAYVGTDQEIWFAVVTPGFNGDQGFVLLELSQNVRGLMRSFLTQTDAPVTSGLSLVVDERTDSLWVTYLNRAMVLRRPSIVDNLRQWELYEYTHSWPLLAEDPYYGLRVQNASGVIHELERNSAADFATITGTGLDAGTVVTSIYWKSRVMTGPRRRVRNLRLERASTSTSVGVNVFTDRANRTVTIPAGKKNANVGYECQGENVQLQINLTESDAAIVLLTVEEVAGVSSRRAS